MNLTADQIKRTDQIWDFYINNDEKFTNAKREFTSQEINTRRSETIPIVLELIRSFLNSDIPLEGFKSQIDSINKRNRPDQTDLSRDRDYLYPNRKLIVSRN